MVIRQQIEVRTTPPPPPQLSVIVLRCSILFSPGHTISTGAVGRLSTTVFVADTHG